MMGRRIWAVVLVTAVLVVTVAGLTVAPRSVSAFGHYVPRGPILIDSNAGFTSANGITGGSGTPSDLYVIEGWEIDASPATGIEIRDTTAVFVIRDVFIHSGTSSFGIDMTNVSGGRVENATIESTFFGIRLDASIPFCSAPSWPPSSSWPG